MLKSIQLLLPILTATMFIACNSVSKQAQEGGWLWKISGNGLSQPSYLFGTYHGTNEILYNYVDSIPGFHQAFNACNQYVGETILLSEDTKSMLSKMNIKMPSNTTYLDLLNEEDYHFLDSIVHQDFKVQLNEMYLKPGHLGLFFEKLKEREELKTKYSEAEIDSIGSEIMDLVLEKKAKEKGYTLVGLEDISTQEKMLFSDDLKQQADELISGLRKRDDYSRLSSLNETLPEVYRAQRIKCLACFEAKLDSLFQTSSELKAIRKQLREVLLKQRNINWMNKIPALIKNKPTFIAVGVRHLPGNNGLIALLLEQGYTVEAVGR